MQDSESGERAWFLLGIMNPPVGNAFMSPAPPGASSEIRQVAEDEITLDVGSEPGSGLAYTGPDGDLRIISREIYQGKTFDDWDDMEANVRRLARKAGFKVVKVRVNFNSSGVRASFRRTSLIPYTSAFIPAPETFL